MKINNYPLSLGVDICPVCGYPIEIMPLGSDKDSHCTSDSCFYTEKAGSANVVSFIHMFLVKTCKDEGVDFFMFNNTRVPSFSFLNPVCAMSLFLARADHILENSSINHSGDFNINLGLVNDKKSPLQSRVVYRSQNIETLPTTLLLLTESISEAYENTLALKRYPKNILSVEGIPGYTTCPFNDLPSTRFMDSLRNAMRNKHDQPVASSGPSASI